MTNAKKNCDTCHKSTLSLLLLRPSPIAKSGPLVPAGAATVTSDEAATAGLLPARLPTESRFALRLLRSGYVHIYVPEPPPGLKNWLVYRVTEQADLIPETSARFGSKETDAPCMSDNHNLAGAKLLHIPQAHKISTIWIAYSANLWNDTLRSRNKTNPKVMQQVSLAGGSPNTFQPSVDKLKSKVLECSLTRLSINKATDHDFAFNSIAAHVEKLAEQLEKAAACHPRTKGKELAVVLRDPVGVAAELNALRLRRHELAKQEIEKPENAHPLNSSNTLMGLKQVMLDTNSLNSYVKVSPLVTKTKFADEKWPAGTEWHPLTPEDRQALVKSASSFWVKLLTPSYKHMFEHPDMGRAVYPDHAARAAAWAKEETEKNWVEIEEKYDETARKQWLDDFNKQMKANHYDPLSRFEADWWEARKDAAFNTYFALHFDEKDPNDPKKRHSPGLTYAEEVKHATTPAPLTRGWVLDNYLVELTADITKSSTVMLRALAANQADVIASIQQVFSVETSIVPGYLHDNRNDKLYDLGNGLVQGALAKYGWLSTSLGHVLSGYTLVVSQSLVAGVSAKLAAPAALISESALLARAASVMLAQRTIDMAQEAMVAGKGPKTPVLITRSLPIDEAMDLLRSMDGKNTGMSRSQLKRVRRAGQGRIDVSVLTDNQALAALNGDVDTAMKQSGVSVKVGSKATSSLAAGALSGTVALSEDQFKALFARQHGVATRAALAAKESIADSRAIVTTLAGRLALGAVLINSIGFLGNLSKINNPKDAQELRYAWYGMYDAASGMLGGMMEVWNTVVTAQHAARVSANVAAAQSLKLTAIRAGAYVTGAVAGIVNAAAAWAKSIDSGKTGDVGAERAYQASMLAFAGTGATSTLISAGIAADHLALRGIGGTAARSIALRFGARGTAALLGISVSGWGLILLGAGLIFEASAIALTPAPIQGWTGRSYFGKNSDKRFSSWPDELAGLRLALEEAAGELKTDANTRGANENNNQEVLAK